MQKSACYCWRGQIRCVACVAKRIEGETLLATIGRHVNPSIQSPSKPDSIEANVNRCVDAAGNSPPLVIDSPARLQDKGHVRHVRAVDPWIQCPPCRTSAN